MVRGDLRSNREEIQTAVLAVDFVMKESKSKVNDTRSFLGHQLQTRYKSVVHALENSISN